MARTANPQEVLVLPMRALRHTVGPILSCARRRRLNLLIWVRCFEFTRGESSPPYEWSRAQVLLVTAAREIYLLHLKACTMTSWHILAPRSNMAGTRATRPRLPIQTSCSRSGIMTRDFNLNTCSPLSLAREPRGREDAWLATAATPLKKGAKYDVTHVNPTILGYIPNVTPQNWLAFFWCHFQQHAKWSRQTTCLDIPNHIRT